MLSLNAMIVRLGLAIVLGLIIGFEREMAGKEAGVRTAMLVSAGASLFAIVGLSLPYIVSQDPEVVSAIISHNGGFLTVIGNIVVGIGFLGAGIIIKTQEHVHGLTTAAAVWATAAVGVLAGIGLWAFAIVSAVSIVVLLYLLRRFNLAPRSEESGGSPHDA